MSGQRRAGGGAPPVPRGPGERAAGAGAASCARRGAAGGADRCRARGRAGQRLPESQDNFQGWMTEPTSLSVGAEQTQKKETVAIRLVKHEEEVGVPPNELGSANTATDRKEQSTSEIRRDYVCRSTGIRPEKTDMIKSFATDQDASRNCELYLPVSSNCSVMESSEDSEEDMYRDAEEIEREKILLCETSSSEHKLSVAPEIDIMEYCRKEWRGNTPVAKRMRKGYEAVAQKFASIRRVRGDNYCALRATLFQALSQATQLPSWLQSEDFTMLPENLLSKYDWIKQWQLKQKLGRKMGEIRDEIKEYLILLRKKVEMFLLAYALQYTIQVYRLYKYSTDEFITLYPNDPEEDWPVVTLITEDDRHYNIPVRMCQETML
ncbi:ubiquitin thioesterase otulin isoform X3 [Strix aluco]|uniref:ubiquitin thioesterase otulin isoform X3 n=1 Tax=Strix aluco TaxID=111821 RepID=UPI003DA52C66